MLVGIGVFLFLGCFGVFVKVHRITLDRQLDLVEISEIGTFGRRQSHNVLRDLHGATLQSMVIKRKPGNTSRTGWAGYNLTPEPHVWRAALVHRSGHAMPLSDIYGSEWTAGTAASAINAWPGAPPDNLRFG